MFQQRHFEAIAQMMQEIKPCFAIEDAELEQWTRTRDALVRLFVRHNNSFDVSRFERACEPGANVRARKAA